MQKYIALFINDIYLQEILHYTLQYNNFLTIIISSKDLKLKKKVQEFSHLIISEDALESINIEELISTNNNLKIMCLMPIMVEKELPHDIKIIRFPFDEKQILKDLSLT